MRDLDENTVLLFYRDYEVDKWIPGDRYLKRLVRPLYNRLTRSQKVSGFLMAYLRLIEALRQQGYTVHSNARSLARRHPDHPVGLAGYPPVLHGWTLPNPTVLGPGLFDHPKQAPDLMRDPRNRFYLVGSQWVQQLFEPYYGPGVVRWFAGIELDHWPDTRRHPKSVDVLLYDKVHWNRDRYEAELLAPIRERLAKRGLRVETLRYGQYDHERYRQALSASRCLLFITEHETQGFAYQEAMASNVPVLAWDQGFWLDPHKERWEAGPVPATSVPYFSEECGERFRGIEDFDDALDRLLARLPEYAPREYVARELSMERSAELYMSYYRRAAEGAAAR